MLPVHSKLVPRLEIVHATDSLASAQLVRFFHGRAPAIALFANADGSRRLMRIRWRPQAADGLWVVDAYALQGDRVERALDRTLFGADAESFSELGRQRERAGPNLHAEPIRLPAELRVGEWHAPFAGHDARVRLEHAGPVELVLGAARATRTAICLLAEEAGVAREQWFVEGVGEVALGPRGEPFERWLLGYASEAGEALFGPLDAALCAGPWPRLPEPGASDAPRSSKRTLF